MSFTMLIIKISNNIFLKKLLLREIVLPLHAIIAKISAGVV